MSKSYISVHCSLVSVAWRRAATRVGNGRNFRRNVRRMRGREPQASATYNTTVPKSIFATIKRQTKSHNISFPNRQLSEYYRYASRLKLMPRIFKQTTYTRVVSAKYSVIPCIEGEKNKKNKKTSKKRLLTWSIARNWSFVDTKSKTWKV